MNALNTLTNAVTAMRTWAELVEAMGTPERQMYCPTIYQDTRRKRLLTKAIVAAGFTVYAGRSVWLKPSR